MKLMRLSWLLAAVILFIATGSANAAVTLSLHPVDDAFAADQPKDGVFDSLFPSSPANIVGGSNSALYRSALEFQLSAIPTPANIISAVLNLHIVLESGSGVGVVGVSVNAYAGNGIAELSDMYVNNVVAGPLEIGFGPPPPLVQFDVTNAIRNLYASGATFAGLTLSSDPSNFILQFGSNDNGTASNRPTLEITYAPVPEPSTLMVFVVLAGAVLMPLGFSKWPKKTLVK